MSCHSEQDDPRGRGADGYRQARPEPGRRGRRVGQEQLDWVDVDTAKRDNCGGVGHLRPSRAASKGKAKGKKGKKCKAKGSSARSNDIFALGRIHQ